MVSISAPADRDDVAARSMRSSTALTIVLYPQVCEPSDGTPHPATPMYCTVLCCTVLYTCVEWARPRAAPKRGPVIGGRAPQT